MNQTTLSKFCVESVLRSSLRPNPSLRDVFSAQSAISLLKTTSLVLHGEPSVLTLSGEFCVVGDLHGSLDSLLRVFSELGWPNSRKYLFLGDYVDRGSCSTAVLFLLYALKLLYPKDVFLIRGNHECCSLTGCYGFKSEIERIYSEEVYNVAVSTFDSLPMAAIVNREIFCVHGGFSPQLKTREDLDRIIKPTNDPVEGLEADLLWSDFEDYVDEWEENVCRGSGFILGATATKNFLKGCGFTKIVRSHQSVEGFDWAFGVEGGCLTVFTAVDYMEKANDGAVALVGKENKLELKMFHPMLGSARDRWRPTWPSWLLENREICGGKCGLEQPPLKRTMSEPVRADSAIAVGVEIKI